MLDMYDEDGVCGAHYQEWYAEQFYFEPPYDPWKDLFDPEEPDEWPDDEEACYA